MTQPSSEVELAVESLLRDTGQTSSYDCFDAYSFFKPLANYSSANFSNYANVADDSSPLSVVKTPNTSEVHKQSVNNTDVKNVKSEVISEDVLNEVAEQIANDLLDDAALGIIFDIHRSAKLGTFHLLEHIPVETQAEYKISHVPHTDIFGQSFYANVQHAKTCECVCPECHRTLAACRFAPHLEKCMGMGRTSSRLASRRIRNTATTAQQSAHVAKVAGLDSEESDDSDVDWTESSSSSRRKTRRKAAVRGKQPVQSTATTGTSSFKARGKRSHSSNNLLSLGGGSKPTPPPISSSSPMDSPTGVEFSLMELLEPNNYLQDRHYMVGLSDFSTSSKSSVFYSSQPDEKTGTIYPFLGSVE